MILSLEKTMVVKVISEQSLLLDLRRIFIETDSCSQIYTQKIVSMYKFSYYSPSVPIPMILSAH